MDQVKHLGRAREMHARHVRRRHHAFRKDGAVAGEELDDALGESCLVHDIQQELARKHGVVGGLPERDVAHDCGRGRQVRGDGNEVERGDGGHKALQWAMLHSVPHACRVLCRLNLMDLRRKLCREAPKVDSLDGRVDLSLPNIFALPQHNQRVQLLAVRPGQEIRGLEKHRRALVRMHRCPLPSRGQRAVNRVLHILRIQRRIDTRRMPMPMRHLLHLHRTHPVLCHALEPLDAVDNQRDVRKIRRRSRGGVCRNGGGGGGRGFDGGGGGGDARGGACGAGRHAGGPRDAQAATHWG
mmetsp:Transcript_5878/g.14331  ORF Transcript_5878/g.14331 Transcript_5878/m.14331 type:complete len:298 (+) Transcript_5878:992-1885(+)